jgi:hypothetical protein
VVSLPSFFVPEGPYSAESTTVCQNIFCGDDEGGVYFSPPRPLFFFCRARKMLKTTPPAMPFCFLDILPCLLLHKSDADGGETAVSGIKTKPAGCGHLGRLLFAKINI